MKYRAKQKIEALQWKIDEGQIVEGDPSPERGVLFVTLPSSLYFYCALSMFEEVEARKLVDVEAVKETISDCKDCSDFILSLMLDALPTYEAKE